MNGMHFSIKLNKSIEQIIIERKLKKGGAVQRHIDSECIRLSTPYVPRLSGTLKGSAIRATTLGSGVVVWSTPYARYQYYGKVMIGLAPKEVSDKDLTYHGGGGKKWFEEMKAAHRDDILRSAAEIAGGRVG